MAFVDEQQRIVGEIFEQGRRRLAGQAPGQEAAVILDPGAAAGGGDHLQVEIGALLEPLRFEQAAFGLELLQPLGEFVTDRLARLLQRRSRGHIVRVRIDADMVEVGDLFPRQRVELGDLLDLVAEEADPPGHIFIVRGEDFEAVAAHAEIAARERLVVALVLECDELADDLAVVDALPFLEVEDHRRIGLDRPDAIEARYRGDDDHIVAFEQRARRRVAHAVDRLVHRAFLLDIGVRPRHIGLGLVIVVIADEIFDRIVREEALEFAVELRREDLVRREDQRGALQLVDDLRHGEGLARTGDAEQHLVALAVERRGNEFADRRRLVAGGFIVANQFKSLAAFDLVGAGGTVRDIALCRVDFVERSARSGLPSLLIWYRLRPTTIIMVATKSSHLGSPICPTGG